MNPHKVSASYEAFVEGQHDCTFSYKEVWCECPCCKEEYSETMHNWQNPHTSARDVWVCSEGCSEEWREKNWDYTPEMEAESRIATPSILSDWSGLSLRERHLRAEEENQAYIYEIAKDIRKHYKIDRRYL